MPRVAKWVRFIALPTFVIFLLFAPIFETLNVSCDDRVICAFLYDKGYFTYEFRHSVNKGLITETYALNADRSLHLKEALFKSYGAGMLDEIPKGVKMRESGEYLKLTFEKHDKPALNCIAGRESKQMMHYGGRELALYQYYGKPLTIYRGKASLAAIIGGYRVHRPLGSFVRV